VPSPLTTLQEIIDSLPNGLHDAQVHSINLDYVKREAKLTLSVWVGSRIREIAELRREFGAGRWRKLKGVATVSLLNGRIRKVELHWYEAHGIAKRKLKIKRYLA
jgi:hypothetical protein